MLWRALLFAGSKIDVHNLFTSSYENASGNRLTTRRSDTLALDLELLDVSHLCVICVALADAAASWCALGLRTRLLR